jgi:hypothetical protein
MAASPVLLGQSLKDFLHEVGPGNGDVTASVSFGIWFLGRAVGNEGVGFELLVSTAPG